MLPFRSILVLIALASLLVACQLTITPIPTPTPDVSITAQSGVTFDPEPRGSIAVPANGSRWIQVTYPSNAAADLMYFEVTGADGILLEFYNETGTSLRLVSRSETLFANSLSRLNALTPSAATSDVDVTSVGIGYQCIGPCVAAPYVGSTRFVRLVNETNSNRNNVQLFAYATEFDDENEPNDTPGTARTYTVTFTGDGPSGALEHVNDRDFHTIQCGGGFPFGDLELTLRAGAFVGDIVLIANNVVYGKDERSLSVPCGATVEVRTLDGTAAAPGTSTYSIVAD